VYTSSLSTLHLRIHVEYVDFVFVAMSMGVMSGFQVLDIATKMHRNIQVICKFKEFFCYISTHPSIYLI
jgi:hypothetical protein